MNDTDKIRLNLGCGAIRPEGWINADSSFNSLLQRVPFLGRPLAKVFNMVEYRSGNVKYMNLNKSWHYRDASVDVVYASHLFEHLTLRAADLFLKESFRVLKKGGIIRLVVPDLHKICLKYFQDYGNEELRDPTQYILWALNLHKEGQYARESFLERMINEYRGYPHQHKFMYDDRSLMYRLQAAGFVEVINAPFGSSSYIPEIRDVEFGADPYLSACIEGVKP